jgi:hypothetical protein
MNKNIRGIYSEGRLRGNANSKCCDGHERGEQGPHRCRRKVPLLASALAPRRPDCISARAGRSLKET